MHVLTREDLATPQNADRKYSQFNSKISNINDNVKAQNTDYLRSG